MKAGWTGGVLPDYLWFYRVEAVGIADANYRSEEIEASSPHLKPLHEEILHEGATAGSATV